MPYVSWKVVFASFIGGILLYIFSLIAHLDGFFAIPTFILLCAAFSLFCLKDIRWGLTLMLIELIVSSHGRLLTLPGTFISLRIAWFSILFLFSIFHFPFWGKSKGNLKNYFTTAYILFFAVIIYGFLRGFLSGHSHQKVFFDGNGYFYILLAPLFAKYGMEESGKKIFLSAIIGSLISISFMVLWLFFVFSNVHLESLSWFYKWARDVRLAEITWAGGNYFRIFLPSQIWLIPGFFLAWFFYKEERLKRYLFLSSIFFVALFLSLSRSFAVGFIFALILFFLLCRAFRVEIKRSILEMSLITVLSVFIFLVIVNVPGNVGGIGGEILASRLSGIEEPGIKSRLSQFKPLLYAIAEHPVLGSGFGREVTYKSFDPRIVRKNPQGLRTTYAFELGYLDLWLKLGLLGLASLGFLIFKLTKILLNTKKYGWVFILGLAGIAAVNAFSPYLNHPLGLGYLAFLGAFLNAETHDTNSKL